MVSAIRSAPLAVFLVMVAIPLLMAGVAVFAGLRARRQAALVKSMPTSNIAMADDGYREFEGTIEAIPGAPTTAPLTKAACVWYQAKVEEWLPVSDTDKMRHQWRIVRETTSDAPFLVRDRTGACIVHPAGADVTPTDKSLWYGATIEPVDTNPAKVGPGDSTKPMLEVAGGPNSRFRYSEDRMYPGNPLFVLGEFATGLVVDSDADVEEDVEVDDDEAALQAAAGTKASIRRGSGERPFILSTTPQSAHVDKMAMGGAAALGVAVVPLAIAALIVWARFA